MTATQIISKLFITASLSLVIVGCAITGTSGKNASNSRINLDGDLNQAPTTEEMSTINNYADLLIEGYDVHLRESQKALYSVELEKGTDISLWEHAIFDMEMVNPKHKYITQQIAQVKKRQRYFEKQLANGHLFLYYIINELKVRKMPLELAVIPIIESNFNPHAISPAGARGIWQFVPGTARNFKLKHDANYDMRRDVISSTNAALTYFDYLYKMFGDWNLAIAAYNQGEGTVLKAIKANRSKGKSTDLWSLHIPRAGLDYVEKLHAYTDLLRNADENNLKFPDMPYRPVFKKVHIDENTTLESLSQKTGISIERLQKLNPGFVNVNKSTTMVKYALIPVHNHDLAENYTLSKVKSLPVYNDNEKIIVSALAKNSTATAEPVNTASLGKVPAVTVTTAASSSTGNTGKKSVSRNATKTVVATNKNSSKKNQASPVKKTVTVAKNDKNSTRNKTQTKPVITAKNGKSAARNSSHTKTVVTAKNKATGRNSSPVKKTSVVKAHAQNNTPKERNNQKKVHSVAASNSKNRNTKNVKPTAKNNKQASSNIVKNRNSSGSKKA